MDIKETCHHDFVQFACMMRCAKNLKKKKLTNENQMLFKLICGIDK